MSFMGRTIFFFGVSGSAINWSNISTASTGKLRSRLRKSSHGISLKITNNGSVVSRDSDIESQTQRCLLPDGVDYAESVDIATAKDCVRNIF